MYKRPSSLILQCLISLSALRIKKKILITSTAESLTKGAQRVFFFSSENQNNVQCAFYRTKDSEISWMEIIPIVGWKNENSSLNFSLANLQRRWILTEMILHKN